MNSIRFVACISLIAGLSVTQDSFGAAQEMNKKQRDLGFKLETAAARRGGRGGTVADVRNLLEQGAPVNGKNNDGLPLRRAAKYPEGAEKVKLLLEAGADVDIVVDKHTFRNHWSKQNKAVEKVWQNFQQQQKEKHTSH